MKDIAVVILNWNGAAMLRKFLPSVLRNSGEARIIVADNASTDDSVEVLKAEFPSVEVVVLDKNYGFAEGYNRALAQVEAKYYMLLNSDVEVPEAWLKPLYDYMETHEEVAACQPKILCEYDRTRLEYAGAAGGYVDYLGYPFCRGRVFATTEVDEGQYDTVADVFWATGAAMLVRATDYWGVNGLDARFFAHQEEIDLCWRLRARGHRIVCVPASKVFHVGGGTLPKENPRKTFLNFRNNMLLLYKNLPDAQYKKVMAVRCFLDALAAFVFLLKGEPKSFKAVWEGRRAFRKMRIDFCVDRKENLRMTTVKEIPELYKKSLLLRYYLHGERTFSMLSK